MANDVLVIMQPAEAEALTQHLQAEGFVVERAADGLAGVERALAGEFALVILDASQLALSGIEFLRRIRQRSLLPALMVSAESNDAERILALVKEIVERHGGRITFESSPTTGSTFTIHLPLQSQAPSGAAQ